MNVTSLVLIIGMDGLASDYLSDYSEKLVHIPQAMRAGAYTLTSRSEVRTLSSINWGTHLYGHGASSHCWMRNDQQPACTGLPSVFDVVKPSFGVSANWPYFATFNPHIRDVQNDTIVMQVALEAVRQRNHRLIFTRFSDVDDANHRGESVEDSVVAFDENVGHLLSELHEDDHALIISDHGGRKCGAFQWTCRPHYGASLREVNTPLVLLGPSVKPGKLMRRVTHQDTSYFVLNMLNLPVPCQWHLGDYYSNCSSEWPGLQISLVNEEEELRDAIDFAINVGLAFLVCLASLLFYKHCVHPNGKYTHL